MLIHKPFIKNECKHKQQKNLELKLGGFVKMILLSFTNKNVSKTHGCYYCSSIKIFLYISRLSD